jgi:HD-GYP domain-containing protein (c-di-GMP phosphodiesterase class II)
LFLNSLKLKIGGLVAIIVIVIISTASWHNFRNQKQILVNLAEKSSIILTESILSSINNAMQFGHSDEVTKILSRIKTHEYINALRIVSTDGKILHSTKKEEIGSFVSVEKRKLLASQVKDHSIFTNTGNIFSSYSIIPNSPECHGCHSPLQTSIAFLETDLYLENFAHYIQREQRESIISSATIITLIVAVLFIFLVYYVDRPIHSLISSMQRVESGDFSVGTDISSSNEMKMLSTNFNLMVNKLNLLMSTTVMHERELIRAQEKLIHHKETQLMNQKLEEQLKEIESLNLSLEERIDEIEQANYTVADMASEIDQKNNHLTQAVERLSSIYKIGLAINSTIDIDRLFNLIVRTTTTTLKAQIGYIILYDAERQKLNVTNLIGSSKATSAGRSIPMKDSGVSTWVIKNRQPLLVTDINHTPQFDRFSELGYERKTLICAPLMVKEEIIGTISVVNKVDDSQFVSDELDMLCTIAAQAAIAIKNATLYEEQQQTYLNTIQALVSAIEASDSYTRGHSERVTRYCVEIGRRMDLPSNRMQVLERAAVLHDIGKIGIDLSLLHKEGKLTPKDIRELQQHPVIGMKILEPIEFLQDVRTCIGQHHERYDGMGYPKRIGKDEQLLEARILAVADSFDAMTSDRPYRKALSLESAVSELLDNAGTQFDPDVVYLFSKIIDEGIFFLSHQETMPFKESESFNTLAI